MVRNKYFWWYSRQIRGIFAVDLAGYSGVGLLMFELVHDKLPKRRRSSSTDDPYYLDQVDFRKPRGRRFRDIVDHIIFEFGPAEDDEIRELSQLLFLREELFNTIMQEDNYSLILSRAEVFSQLTNTIEQKKDELRVLLLLHEEEESDG
jgi:hypothetical protein